MSSALSEAALASDPAWLAHRYQPQGDLVGFRLVPRDRRRVVPFLTDANLDGCGPMSGLRRERAVALLPNAAPLHFIFHSAFCCSTLVANVLDQPGIATTLKEPVILNDILGWQARGANPARVNQVLDSALHLLARPFAPGEAVIVKPSNVVSALVPAMLQLRPDARALLLTAPLPVFLASVARKGLEGRLWVRELGWKFSRDRFSDFGFSEEERFRHTDLQVAALGWLAQHRLFASLAQQLGPQRIRTLDSEELLKHPVEAVARMADHFGLPMTAEEALLIAGGPSFTRNAKTGAAFDASDRQTLHEASLDAHAEELCKVEAWANAVATHAAIPLKLPAPLLP